MRSWPRSSGCCGWRRGAAAGSCPNCSAPHSRGAVYCWQCGTTLMERLPSDAVSDGDVRTAMMDALLAPPQRAGDDED